MWLYLAFTSAALLGLYDTAKKKSLKDNAVIPVLLINTAICSLIFLPFIILSSTGTMVRGDFFYVPSGSWSEHRAVIIKSALVLSSWICGYFGIKRLPLTIVGPINATRPVLVLLGAMLIFGERLNFWQWGGVLLAVLSFFMLSLSGRKEGIDFKANRWIHLIILAALFGAASGLYDRYILSPTGLGLDRMFVQSWYNIYQCAIMSIILVTLWYPNHKHTTPFHWDWAIILISIFLSAADFVYYYALTDDDAMISIVSMIRRGSVIISFLAGAVFFREKNLRSKALDLLLVLIGMVFLYIGSR